MEIGERAVTALCTRTSSLRSKYDYFPNTRYAILDITLWRHIVQVLSAADHHPLISCKFTPSYSPLHYQTKCS